jgi:hypothetical protein
MLLSIQRLVQKKVESFNFGVLRNDFDVLRIDFDVLRIEGGRQIFDRGLVLMFSVRKFVFLVLEFINLSGVLLVELSAGVGQISSQVPNRNGTGISVLINGSGHRHGIALVELRGNKLTVAVGAGDDIEIVGGHDVIDFYLIMSE